MASLAFPLGGPLGGDLDSGDTTTPPVVPAPVPPSPANSAAAAANLPRDFAITPSGDLDLTNGVARMTTGKEAIRQSLTLTMRQVQGEWFKDLNAGLDVFGIILGTKASDAQISGEIRRRALQATGVVGIQSITLTRDRANRTLTADVEALSDVGVVVASVRLGN